MTAAPTLDYNSASSCHTRLVCLSRGCFSIPLIFSQQVWLLPMASLVKGIAWAMAMFSSVDTLAADLIHTMDNDFFFEPGPDWLRVSRLKHSLDLAACIEHFEKWAHQRPHRARGQDAKAEFLKYLMEQPFPRLGKKYNVSLKYFT